MVSHIPTKSGDEKYHGNRDMIFLVFHLISQDHMAKG